MFWKPCEQNVSRNRDRTIPNVVDRLGEMKVRMNYWVLAKF